MMKSLVTQVVTLAAVFLVVASSNTVAATEEENKEQQHPLLKWLFQHDGASFDSDTQRIATDDNTIFATHDIPQGSVLATIPWSATIGPDDDDEDDDTQNLAHFHCGTARALNQELQHGDTSPFKPYLEHLQSLSPKKRLPSQYSPPAKALLLEILGGEDSSSLLMERAVHYDFWEWKVLCGETNNEEDEDTESSSRGVQGAMWVQQHAFDDRMIPLKDFYTHRNGHYHNTDLKLVPGQYVQIVARRDIQSGEQLHTSYTECELCNEKIDEQEGDEYGTPEIFRDHGIIESMPQLWSIPETRLTVPYEDENGHELEVVMNGIDMVFRLEETTNNDNKIEVQFLFEEFQPFFYSYMEALFRFRIEVLHRLKNIDYPGHAEDYDMAPYEWEAIWDFHEAYSMALKRAVVELHHLILKEQEDSQQQLTTTTTTKTPDRFCRDLDHWEDHYTDFQVELDHLAYNNPDCESSELVDFFSYEVFEKERSNYQEMLWQYREEDDDTCLHLDGMLQICSSYRPHYHEFFVHFPAQYMNSVKRVIFLGSGDAMLLHEILKYPHLEKVVGLELDQTVTRKSFQHFKTQPHYDDPRVEWWYGDATKTLPLLPRDYWGSFDLLLVDLSETVVSLHVTGKHDVLDVISMLLKPEGVMLENELYIDKMARHFDHTVHIFYGSPKVCVQVHTVSSNSVDFMTSPIHDHDIDMFLIDKVEEPSDRFKYIHDYIETDPIAQGKCKDHDDAIDLITTEYGRKAGILMVVEAEKCSKDLNDGASLEELILQVLESAGLSPLSSSAGARDDQSIQVVMKEGYVAARVWPELQYVGFDLHFWGAFSKMEGVRASLMEALDSQTTSSYRVVVGGMHGSSTWSQDEQEIGVQFSQKRNCTAPDVSSKKLNTNDAISVAIDESLDLLADAENVVVAVVCGPQEKEDDCLALQILKDHPQVDTIVPIFACQGIPDFNNGTFDYQPMYDCEKEIIERLESLNEDEDTTLDAFMIDLSAPLSMVQIFASIWAVPDHRDDWLEQPYIVAMPFLREDPKRKRFMDLFRKFGHGTVSTMAEVIFKGASAQDYLGWRVFTFDDQTAVHSISEMERSLQERLPETNIKVRLLEGGQRHTEADLMLEERSFRPEDYDYGPNQKQMSEQRSLGRQTVFQLERTFDDEVSMPSMVELVSGLKTTLASMGYETNAEPEQFSTVGDGAVVTSVFAQGSAVMVWDGLDHVDINLFCLNETHELADQFLKFFIESVDHRLERSLRDDMPRGIGRVVNFQSDMVARESLTAEIER